MRTAPAMMLIWLLPISIASAQPVLPTVTLAAKGARDQDDMCIWRDAKTPSRSAIITSDKKANKLFVYDLTGKKLQEIVVYTPGNIDIRQGVKLGGKARHVVAVNQRARGYKIRVFAFDPATRKLTSIDGGGIATGENYGGTLYHSRKTDKLYFIITSMPGHAVQYELTDVGGTVKGKMVRKWRHPSKCEGAMADDALGRLYIAEERAGIWEMGAEPDAPAPGKLVIKDGENGLSGNCEGIALLARANGKGLIVVSNQRGSNFKVYEREAGHAFVGTFSIKGGESTDGIDLIGASLGDAFPSGMFACHTSPDSDRENRICPVLLTPLHRILKRVEKKEQK